MKSDFIQFSNEKREQAPYKYMMPRSFIFILCLCLSMLGQAQNSSESIISETYRADLIDVDIDQNIYLLNSKSNVLYKYFADISYDSLIHSGGKSTRNQGLLSPVKFRVLGPQQLYMFDEGTQQILVWNTDLDIVRRINLEHEDDPNLANYSFKSFTIGPLGEIFVVNSLDNKVYQIDKQGNPSQGFGGSDYGEGSLWNPQDIQTDNMAFLYVGDPEEQKLSVFDQFGIFHFALSPKIDFSWTDFLVNGSLLLYFNDTHVQIEDIRSGRTKSYTHKEDGKIIDLAVSKKGIYLLTENAVHLLKFSL